jgi:hypothetical protein
LRFLLHALGIESQQEKIDELQRQVEENEKKIEKLVDAINILATFDERMAKDIRNVASHVALMELSILEKRKANVVSLKRKSNDDDMLN